MRINYHQFRQELLPIKCFSLQDARKHFPDFDRRRLSEWKSKGYIEKVANSYYLFSEVPRCRELDWFVANRIYGPSYISLHSALSHYEVIPEEVFQITSIATRKTKKVAFQNVECLYYHIKPDFFLDYRLWKWKNTVLRVATLEKALLDLLYLFPKMDEREDFEEWRLNKSILKKDLNTGRMKELAAYLGNKQLTYRMEKLIAWINA